MSSTLASQRGTYTPHEFVDRPVAVGRITPRRSTPSRLRSRLSLLSCFVVVALAPARARAVDAWTSFAILGQSAVTGNGGLIDGDVGKGGLPDGYCGGLGVPRRWMTPESTVAPVRVIV